MCYAVHHNLDCRTGWYIQKYMWWSIMSKRTHDDMLNNSIHDESNDTKTANSTVVYDDINQLRKFLAKHSALDRDILIERSVKRHVDNLLAQYGGDQQKMLASEGKSIQIEIATYYAVSSLKIAGRNQHSNILTDKVFEEAVKISRELNYPMQFNSLLIMIRGYNGVGLDYIWQNLYNATEQTIPEDFLRNIEFMVSQWKKDMISNIPHDDFVRTIFQGAELGLSVNTVYMCFAATYSILSSSKEQVFTYIQEREISDLIPWGVFGQEINKRLHDILSSLRDQVLPNNVQDIVLITQKYKEERDNVVQVVMKYDNTYKPFSQVQATQSDHDTQKSEHMTSYEKDGVIFSKKCIHLLQNVMYIPFAQDISLEDIAQSKKNFCNEIKLFTDKYAYSDTKNDFIAYVKDKAINRDITEFIVLYAYMLQEGIAQDDCNYVEYMQQSIGLLGTPYDIVKSAQSGVTQGSLDTETSNVQQNFHHTANEFDNIFDV